MPTRKEIIQRNAKIVAAIKSGKTNKEVAEKFAITRECVRLIGLKEGLLSINNQKKVRDIKIIRDFEKGISLNGLSLKYDLSHSTLKNIFAASGLPSESKTKKALRNKNIVDMFTQGLTIKRIAALSDLGYASVLRVLNLAGLYSMISKEEAVTRGKDIITDIKNGKKASEICGKYSIGVKRINQITGEAGFSYLKMRQIRNEKIIHDFEDGIPLENLALKYKLSFIHINRILKK